MKFVCDRCQTKYSIADERVHGKVLKVKCKTCANLITVREARRGSSGAGLPTIGHAQPPHAGRAAQAAHALHEDPPPEADFEDSARTAISPFSEIAAAMQAAPAPAPPASPRRTTGSISTVGLHPEDGLQWYMALDGQRSGPFSRKQLVDKIAPLPKQADLHVWNEKLGSWKPPADVPAIAAELAARRKPPAPPPGAPRRMTMSPPPPVAAAPHPPSATAHASASHAPVPSRRQTTGPIPAVGGGAPKLPLPSHAPPPRPVDLFAPAVPPTIPPRAEDPSALLQTPGPEALAAHAHGTNGANGASLESITGRPPMQSSSDVLRMLNLPAAAPGPAPAPPAAPRIMSGSEVVGWTPGAATQTSRTKQAPLILAFFGVVAVVAVVLALSFKKPKPSAPVAAPKPTVTDPLAAVVEKAAEKPPVEPEAPVAPNAPVVAPGLPGGRGKPPKGQPHGRKPGAPGAAMGPTSPPPQGGTTTPTPAPTPGTDTYDKYRDGKNLNIQGNVANRPPPSQSDISRVISNNRNGIKTCYQRALLRDSSLTHGKVTVTLNIGISGRVKKVIVDGPTQFRAVEPCMREVVSRWAFPQASEEYGTEFVYVFQGNE